MARKKEEDKDLEEIQETLEVMDALAIHFEEARRDIRKALERQREIIQLKKEHDIITEENEQYRKQQLKHGWDKFQGRTAQRKPGRGGK